MEEDGTVREDFEIENSEEAWSIFTERYISMEPEIALAVKDDSRIKLPMTIPGINVYSAAVIISEIDDVPRFRSKEKFSSYAGLAPKQNKSGDRDIRGHISKNLRANYLSIVRRVGSNRAIVAITGILAELIFTMLRNSKEFMDKIDSLTERKMRSMYQKAKNAKDSDTIADPVKLIRKKLFAKSSEYPFS